MDDAVVAKRKPGRKPRIPDQKTEVELKKVDNQFSEMERQTKEMTHDRRVSHPMTDVEPQTKLSSSEIAKSKDIYLKPIKSIGCREKFDEKWRNEYNFQKEYVPFIAENHEIIGEEIDLWTRPFPGMPAEEWKVPTNTPVWGPRYLAEQIKRKTYRVLKMDESKGTGDHASGQYYGQLCVESHKPRLNATPVSTRKSIFMGASGL